MSLVAEQSQFLKHFVQLLQKSWDMGYTVTGGELYRTIEQQQLYVQQGRSQTLNSNHLRRLAVDLNFFLGGKLVQTKAELQPLGEYWESLDVRNRWGGNFRNFVDIVHFERNV